MSDPNKLLMVIREHAEAVLAGSLIGNAAELAEAFDTLDYHLKQGGELPTDWKGAAQQVQARCPVEGACINRAGHVGPHRDVGGLTWGF